MRILRFNEICTEQYEEKGQESIVHECLKVFTKNLKNEGDEWSIP
jgi:hypothetical protein